VEYKENKKERKLKMILRKREICIVKLAENDIHLRTPFINISMLKTVYRMVRGREVDINTVFHFEKDAANCQWGITLY
jgi:hypothetical protein